MKVHSEISRLGISESPASRKFSTIIKFIKPEKRRIVLSKIEIRLILTGLTVSGLLAGCLGIGSTANSGHQTETPVPMSSPTATVEDQNKKQEPTKVYIKTPPTSVPTSTLVPTVFLPTATLEPTIEPTATKVPLLEVFHEFKDIKALDFSKIPTIKYEDLTSGKLAETELALLKSGEVEGFSKDVIPYPKTFMHLADTSKLDRSTWKQNPILFDYNSETADAINKYFDNPKALPYRFISASFINVDGTRLLLLGVAYINKNNDIGFLHFAIQDYQNSNSQKRVNETFIGKRILSSLVEISDPKFTGNPNLNFPAEPIMVNRYMDENDRSIRYQLFRQFVDTGEIPTELEKIPIIPYLNPFSKPSF